MSIDLNNLSARELSALIAQANKRKKNLDSRRPANQVKASINKLLRESGWTLEELFGADAGGTAARAPRAAKAAPAKKRAGRKLGKVAPKYRNPANAKETWTGRGKQPRWLASLVSKGQRAEDFLISAAPTPKPVKPGKRVFKKDDK